MLKSTVGVFPRNFIERFSSVVEFPADILESRWSNTVSIEPEQTNNSPEMTSARPQGLHKNATFL